MKKADKTKPEKEISKEEAFKAVFEYATWGALIRTVQRYVNNFFQLLSDALRNLFRI